MRNLARCLFVAVLGLTIGPATQVRAGLVLYPNLGTWSGAVTGVTNVAIPDPSPNPFIFIGSGTASVTYGGVIFSTSSTLGNSSFFNVGPLFSGSPAVLSSQSATTGVENILITLAGPVTAFSLNYGTFGGGSVTFHLSNGDQVTRGSTGSGYAVPDFFGVTDTTSFTSVLVTSSDSVLNLNSIAFGTAIAVPEPNSLALCGIAGVLGLAVSRVRRNRAVT